MQLSDFRIMSSDLRPDLLIYVEYLGKQLPVVDTFLNKNTLVLLGGDKEPLSLTSLLNSTKELSESLSIFVKKDSSTRVYGFKIEGDKIIIN